MLNLAGLVVVASVVVGQTENASYAHLKEYGDDVVGRWIGEGTLTGDLPGLGEKGDAVTGHAVTEWILDKTAIQCDWNFGTAAGKWIVVWDAANGRIRKYAISSSGNIAESVIKKDGDTWIETSTSATSDGKSFSFTAIGQSKDNGMTFVWDETKQILGGEKQPDLRHTWKRVDR